MSPERKRNVAGCPSPALHQTYSGTPCSPDSVHLSSEVSPNLRPDSLPQPCPLQMTMIMTSCLMVDADEKMA